MTNLVVSSSILSDFEEVDVDFEEIISFYEALPETFKDRRQINIAMTMMYSRLSDHKKMVFHLEKIIKSKEFVVQDLCNYGYWRCFDKSWRQSDFFKYGKFVDENLRTYPQDKVVKLSLSLIHI